MQQALKMLVKLYIHEIVSSPLKAKLTVIATPCGIKLHSFILLHIKIYGTWVMVNLNLHGVKSPEISGLLLSLFIERQTCSSEICGGTIIINNI